MPLLFFAKHCVLRAARGGDYHGGKMQNHHSAILWRQLLPPILFGEDANDIFYPPARHRASLPHAPLDWHFQNLNFDKGIRIRRTWRLFSMVQKIQVPALADLLLHSVAPASPLHLLDPYHWVLSFCRCQFALTVWWQILHLLVEPTTPFSRSTFWCEFHAKF